MKPKNSIFTRLDQWFMALSKRERIMVLLALFLVPIYLYAQLVYLPNQQQQKKLHSRHQAAQQDNKATQLQLDELNIALQKDPDEKGRHQLSQLRSQIDKFDEALRSNLAGLVPPENMAGLLRGMLRKQAGLKLVALKNIAPSLLVAPADSAGSEGEAVQEPSDSTESVSLESGSPTLYRHGIEVKFTGSYLATLKYLRHLQDLSQRLFWDGATIEMSEHYPSAEVTLSVYTLSFQEGWIGG